VQDLVGQLGEGRGPADHGREIVDRPLLHGRHGDELLGEDVERVAGVAGGLDVAVTHPADHHRGLDQVAAVLGEQGTPGRLADLVASAPDALQATADRTGGRDLDDEVDRPHVDAELERRGRHQAPELAGLELVLDREPALA
jgi:hypothetical protein